MPNKNKQAKIKILEQALKTGKIKRQEYIRVQAVYLNLIGYTHQEICRITLKSLDALEKWITLFNQKGLEGLKDQPITKPRHCQLNNEQKDQIKKLIMKNNPEALGLKGEFWNIHNLKQLVKSRFKITYQSRKAYVDLLKYCGFTYQKVEYKDSREDQEYKEHEQLRLEKKLKKGVLRMYW